MRRNAPRLLGSWALAVALCSMAPSSPVVAQNVDARAPTSFADDPVTRYRRLGVDGIEIFYREAGATTAPVVVLLHGFPSSSHMFRELIPILAQSYRVIAPDYPGFGHSEAPPAPEFDYSFARFAELMDLMLARLEIERYSLYVMDYGAPVGYRLALRHPERVTALVVQNGNAYAEGLEEFWDPIKAYWASGSDEHREALRAGTTLEATRAQYMEGAGDVSRVDPSAWVHDQALLDRPGNVEVQLDLFYDYRTNVELYPRFQEFFREHQPPALIVWGKNDRIFPPSGAHAYLRDLPDAELHLLDTGHFALEEQGARIGALMLDFLDRTIPRQ